MNKEIFVDVRELPAPEPLEVMVNTLGELEFGAYIKMHHRQMPNMLFPILTRNGYGYFVQKGEDEVFVYIYIKKDKQIKKELEDVLK